MTSTRLGQKPGSFYLSLFDDSNIEIIDGIFRPCIDDEPTLPNHGMTRIDGGDTPFQFDLVLPANESEVPEIYIEIAKKTLIDLGDLDERVRQPIEEDPTWTYKDFDENISLYCVQIKEQSVDLAYFWHAENSEWSSVFVQKLDGSWEYVGTC